jgi:hypothetical protein
VGKRPTTEHSQRRHRQPEQRVTEQREHHVREEHRRPLACRGSGALGGRAQVRHALDRPEHGGDHGHPAGSPRTHGQGRTGGQQPDEAGDQQDGRREDQRM